MRISLATVCTTAMLAACQSGGANLAGNDEKFGGSRDTAGIAASEQVGNEKTASITKSDDVLVADAKPSTGSKPAKKIVIGNYQPPEKGTVFAFKNNWASLEPKLVYKVVSTGEKFAGKPAVKLAAIEGTGNGSSTYLSAQDANLLGHKDKNGNVLSSFVKVEQRLKFPMQPGDKWVAQWKTLDHKSKKTQSGGGVVYVIGVDTIRTPAGNFKTMKIKLPVPAKAGKGIKHHIWYSPKYGMILREQISDTRFSWVKEIERIQSPSS